MYDYLVVGAGLFGSVFAYEMTKIGKKCLVIDKRGYVGGNCYTTECSGITVHQHGPHIFHTKRKEIWEYVNQFAEFNRFTNSPIAMYGGCAYNLPFNMNTFNQLWGVTDPDGAKAKIESQIVKCDAPANLEEKALSLVGTDIYEKLIKGYTEKQWGKPCAELSPEIITRIPLRFTFDNSYFSDPYQGVPIGGYTPIFHQLLKGSTVLLNADFSKNQEFFGRLADKIVYTGPVDELYGYKHGELPYRSLRFEHETFCTQNCQGNAVINYTDKLVPYTRSIEHRHFCETYSDITVVSKEYPMEFSCGRIPYYPVNNPESEFRYSLYAEDAKRDGIILGGRIGMYRYFDMDETIRQAIMLAQKIKR